MAATEPKVGALDEDATPPKLGCAVVVAELPKTLDPLPNVGAPPNDAEPPKDGEPPNEAPPPNAGAPPNDGGAPKPLAGFAGEDVVANGDDVELPNVDVVCV